MYFFFFLKTETLFPKRCLIHKTCLSDQSFCFHQATYITSITDPRLYLTLQMFRASLNTYCMDDNCSTCRNDTEDKQFLN